MAPLSPIDAGDALSPIPVSAAGDFLSPIAATDDSPSPGQVGTAQVQNLSPIATSASSSSAPAVPPPPPAGPSVVAVPPVPPSLQTIAAPEGRSGAMDAEAAGVTARLCRELEQLRSEMASAAAEHKAAQEREQARSKASLSALSQELANEVSENRRWRAETAAKDESLKNLRTDAAARLAAQELVAANLDAQLAAVKTELTRAKAESAERSPTEPSMPPNRVVEEEFLPSDALSPPTPELVSILVAELRPSASSKVSPPASAGGQDQTSLWSQLEKDVNSTAPSAATPKEKTMVDFPMASAAASSSLDVSSLSAVFLERSPEACLDPHACSPLCGPCDMEASPAHDEWMKVLGQVPSGAAAISAAQKPQRGHHLASESGEEVGMAGAKSAVPTKAGAT